MVLHFKSISVYIPDHNKGTGCQAGSLCSMIQNNPVHRIPMVQLCKTFAWEATVIQELAFGITGLGTVVMVHGV